MNWNYPNKNAERSRALRKAMTPHERKLWYCFLKGYPMKFYRQRPVGNYILDFYCSAAKLAVELDGGQHFEAEGAQADKERDRFLTSLGLRILRFSNLDIDNHFLAVCEQISGSLREGAVSEAD